MSDCQKNDAKTNGRWTQEEHQKFLQGLQLFGKDWKKIQTLIGTRNGAQIRSHAQKYFIKVKKDDGNINSNVHEQPVGQSHFENNSSLPFYEIETKSEYSYFLNKIVQKSSKTDESFDFWSHLIDHKPINSQQLTVASRRKKSFVNVQQDNDQEESHLRKLVKCD